MRTYQNIIIDGKDNGHLQRKKNSMFYNEGKWNNFIDPLLPKDCKDMSFVELGCNAGLFLKLATEKGFRDVLGVEASRNTYKAAVKYRDQLGHKYKLINKLVDDNFIENYSQMPVADVTLMSNFHYYLQLRDLLYLINRLRLKTCYVLIVSAEPAMINNNSRAYSTLAQVRRYFRDWEEVGYIPTVPEEVRIKDSYPRPGLWSILFRSPCKMDRTKIDSIWKKHEDRMAPGSKLPPILRESVKSFMRGERPIKETPENIRFFNTVNDVKENGIKEPVLIRNHNRIVDGSHRVETLRELGYSSVITFRE